MIRIVPTNRRVATHVEMVRSYFLTTPDGKLRTPTKEDVMNAQIVVVTLKSSLYLTKLQLSGAFTHVFVDEATQGLECEALMPLLMAREKTCVVITGDVMQVCVSV